MLNKSRKSLTIRLKFYIVVCNILMLVLHKADTKNTGTRFMITNDEFVKAVFSNDYLWCHVTDFIYDPGAIPRDKHLIAWKGDYYCRYNLAQGTNQYFTISTFYCDDHNQARRRKSLFRQTHCIVLDDVKEKLSMDQVQKLPSPSWILETSQGSEQWGYILNTPCTDRNRVENLLDGLVANGLAPDGKDPGMKGVTRYLRLPEGVNSKLSKLVNGRPWQCRMLLWNPFDTVTMEQLAEPFLVNLDALRREHRLDGATAISDHPLINIPNVIHIKEVRSDGRFDIRCPWVEEHTGADDSGSAVFTNDDGSIGFKCHHGACQHRTGRDLLNFIDSQMPGWSVNQLKMWQITRDFQTTAPVSFMGEPQPVSFMSEHADTPVVDATEIIQNLCNDLHKTIPGTTEARLQAAAILKHVDDLPKMDQKHWHNIICDIMRWSKVDFKEIIKDLRRQWYIKNVKESDFYDSVMFVKELNQFYDFKTRIFFSTEAFQNSFSHEDTEAKKIALQDGRVKKVDKLDYAPKQTLMFQEGGITYGNMWTEQDQPKGKPGDITPWREHFRKLGWEEHFEHMQQWMAFTLRHPEEKINHMLLLGSGEGCGKDFLLYPLIKGMGENGYTISGDELTSDFDDYLLSTKYLHINETDLADHRKAVQVSNKLKPIAAAPPDRLTVNQKGIKRIKIRNIINGSMTTNSQLPVRLNGPSRRFYAVWSDLNTRDVHGQITEKWESYWNAHWEWMKREGWEYVLYYLHHVVNLENFKPFSPPLVTEFLKEIQNSSKTPQQLTVEAFINNKVGLFSADIMTAQDMSDTIRTEGVFSNQYVYCDIKYLTPITIGRALSTIPGVYKSRGNICGSTTRLYIIRNIERYADIGPTRLYEHYTTQMAGCRGEAPNLKTITAIKKEIAL